MPNAEVARSAVPVTTLQEDGGGVTGGVLTLSAALPVFPSLVATMFVEPAANADTIPVAETVATPGTDDDHVTDRPVRTFPLASRSVAVACVVCPAKSDEADSATVILATGAGVTLSGIDPLFPSLAAVTVTEPGARPVTTPLGETVAAAVFEEVQLTVRPLSSCPAASRSVTVTCKVVPTTRIGELAESVTLATGAGAGAATVTVAPPV